MSETTRLKSTIYVGGLDQSVTAHTLAEAFVPFGEVVDISLPKPDQPNSTDLHRGYGYVEFDLPQDAKEAIDNMDGSEIYGRTIKVAQAKPQKDANEGLGSKTAIWEQVRRTRFYIFSHSELNPISYRRAIWPSMQSARRTGKSPKRRKQPTVVRKTRCRAWNS
jgi:peptidylprolyl isomerase